MLQNLTNGPPGARPQSGRFSAALLPLESGSMFLFKTAPTGGGKILLWFYQGEGSAQYSKAKSGQNLYPLLDLGSGQSAETEEKAC